jgi:2-polyprenyl-3-methyl-5-hydroxy-6-metoxy-1,4-benzoquinol methylase
MSQQATVSKPPMSEDIAFPAGDGSRARGDACLLCDNGSELVLAGVTDNRLGAPGEYEIRRCLACGLEQTFPVPTQPALTELYERFYNFGGVKGTLYTSLRQRFLSSFINRVWAKIDGDVAFHLKKGQGRLLDVGCNEGRGLAIFVRNGFRVEGLELNSNAAEVAREAGFTVHTCLIEEFHPHAKFDVAVLSNVLEHSLEPGKMLVDVHRVLADGGRIWISCPNSRSWVRTVFGKRWINWHVPFHISHFSESTLYQLLEKSGYTKIEIRQITPALWIAQSLIASMFAKPGKKTSQLRNPYLTLIFMTLARFVAFPALWLGNRLHRGDCLQVIAIKSPAGAN